MRSLIGLVLAIALGCGSGGMVPAPEPPNRGGLGGPSWQAPPPPTVPVRGPFPELGEQPVWQAGFHQALRWDVSVDRRTTFRIRVPVARTGTALRIAFRSGDGDATLHGATVARAGVDGALASEPLGLTFDGRNGFAAGPRERVVSDPLRLRVAFAEELYVSFEVEGHLAAGAIDLFPDSWKTTDSGPAAVLIDDRTEHRAIGLASILVTGPPTRTFVALGDSITEAFVDGRDDYRRNWPQVAERIVGLPLLNAAVSGQGLWGALEFLDEEVLVLPGVTDCLVLLGTNDLGGADVRALNESLARLFEELKPFCTVWAGTLPPKQRSEIGDRIKRDRQKVNEWLREEADVAGVIDFEQVLAEPDDVDDWLPGLDEDGVHPSVRGQRVMGEEAARFIVEEVLGSGAL